MIKLHLTFITLVLVLWGAFVGNMLMDINDGRIETAIKQIRGTK